MKLRIVALVVVLVVMLFASAKADPVEFVSRFASPGQADGQLGDPSGICVDPAGNVYVADTYNERVQKFSTDGVFLGKWPLEAPGEQTGIIDVAADPAGNIYVTAIFLHKIIVLDNNLNYVREWNVGGYIVNHLAIDPTGTYLYASLQTPFGDSIIKYTIGGTFVSSWPIGDTEFRGIACSDRGTVYVAFASLVYEYSESGQLLNSWTGEGGSASLSRVYGVAVGPDGSVFVTSGNDHAVKFASDGTYIDRWGTEGTGDGQFRLTIDIAADSSGNVFVLDYLAGSIQKFRSIPTDARHSTWGGLKARFR